MCALTFLSAKSAEGIHAKNADPDSYREQVAASRLVRAHLDEVRSDFFKAQKV